MSRVHSRESGIISPTVLNSIIGKDVAAPWLCSYPSSHCECLSNALLPYSSYLPPSDGRGLKLRVSAQHSRRASWKSSPEVIEVPDVAIHREEEPQAISSEPNTVTSVIVSREDDA